MERMWRPNEDSADGIPDAGFALRELVCAVVRASTGMFFVLIVGIAAGVDSVVAAMRWED
jgi:hypothetical protein